MVGFLYQLPISRLPAYALFSTILFVFTFWRYSILSSNESTHKLDAPTSNLNLSADVTPLTIDAIMQDSYIVVGIFNMVLCLIILSMKVFQLIFFGALIGTEPQQLREKLTRFAFFRLVFVLGVINSVKWSSLLGWTLWFNCLGALHGFARLGRIRCELLVSTSNTPKRQWVRFSFMLIFLLIGVVLLLTLGIKFCLYLSDVTPETDFWGQIEAEGSSKMLESDHEELTDGQTANFYQVIHVLIFMVSECLLVTLLILHIVISLFVHGIDRANLLQNKPYFDRPTWTYYINLFFDISSLILDLANLLHMLVWSHILSLTSLIVFIQIRLTYAELTQRFKRHASHRLLVDWVRLDFPWGSFEPKTKTAEKDELTEDSNPIPESCAICWDPLFNWRKLPCNHCFHEACLTYWMEQNRSCPTCRRPLSLPSQFQRHLEPRTFTRFLREALGFSEAGLMPSVAGENLNEQPQSDQTQQVPRTGLPTVHGMAVRLRQRGDPLTGTLINNQGPSLDVSIRVSLGSNQVNAIAAARTAAMSDPVASDTGMPNNFSSDPTEDQSATPSNDREPQAERRQVIQSTIRRQFFHFDGSRYLSWLPTVHVELSEIFGELLALPPGQTAREAVANLTEASQTADAVSTTSSPSVFSRFLSLFYWPSLVVPNQPAYSSMDPLHALTPELRAQADEIAAMFPNILHQRILLDLASTGVPEATVENILAGNIVTDHVSHDSYEPLMDTLETTHSPSSSTSISTADDTQLRRRNITQQSGASQCGPPVMLATEPNRERGQCADPQSAAAVMAERKRLMILRAREKFLAIRTAAANSDSTVSSSSSKVQFRPH